MSMIVRDSHTSTEVCEDLSVQTFHVRRFCMDSLSHCGFSTYAPVANPLLSAHLHFCLQMNILCGFWKILTLAAVPSYNGSKFHSSNNKENQSYSDVGGPTLRVWPQHQMVYYTGHIGCVISWFVSKEKKQWILLDVTFSRTPGAFLMLHRDMLYLLAPSPQDYAYDSISQI